MLAGEMPQHNVAMSLGVQECPDPFFNFQTARQKELKVLLL